MSAPVRLSRQLIVQLRVTWVFLLALAAYDGATLASALFRGHAGALPDYRDMLLLLFAGNPEVAAGSMGSSFPFGWMLGEVLVALGVGSISHHLLGDSALNVVERCQTAQNAWNLLLGTCLLFGLSQFVTSLLVCGAFALIGGGGGGDALVACGIDSLRLSAGDVVWLAALVLFSRLALCAVQALISLLLGSFWSLVSLVSFLVVSALLPWSCLFGDWGMIARSSLFSAAGVTPQAGVVFGLLIVLFCWQVGGSYAMRFGLVRGW